VTLVERDVVCIDNIGPRGRRRRFMGGVAGYLASAAIVAGFVVAGISGAAWLLLFIPLMGAGIGVFQALEKT
jgi:hypothetical protein